MLSKTRPLVPAGPPAIGIPVEIAPGILWLRLPLPIRLNHVNVYLFEDEGGWAVLDTGFGDDGCRNAWEGVLSGVMGGRPITRLIGSHFHLDHIGLAGWLHERFGASFYMTQTEYLLAHVFEMDNVGRLVASQTEFFRESGLDLETAEWIARDRLHWQRWRTPLPPSFERLRAGQSFRLGGRDWQVLTGGGHSVEQLMLHCDADNLFIAADQVLPEISPNISVGHIQPHGDPLGDFLQSLKEIAETVADDVLVLPGHRMPFLGLHGRLRELADHHESRCRAILAACADEPLNGFELVPVVFGRTHAREVIASAVGEALAHANYLHDRGSLRRVKRSDGSVGHIAVR